MADFMGNFPQHQEYQIGKAFPREGKLGQEKTVLHLIGFLWSFCLHCFDNCLTKVPCLMGMSYLNLQYGGECLESRAIELCCPLGVGELLLGPRMHGSAEGATLYPDDETLVLYVASHCRPSEPSL